jgi:hypothetical protein
VAVGAGRIRLIPTDERRSLMLTVTELELLAVSTFTAAFRHASAAWISFERLFRRVRLGSGAEGWGVAATASPVQVSSSRGPQSSAWYGVVLFTGANSWKR